MDITAVHGDTLVNGGTRPAITYSVASEDRVGELVHIGLHRMFPEFGLEEQFPIDPMRVSQYVKKTFHRGVVFIAEEDGIIAGSLGLHLDMPWWSSQNVFYDSWFYVKPEYRDRGVARVLLNLAKTSADNSNVPLVIGIHNAADFRRKDLLMKRSGFGQVGGWYVMEK